MVSEERVFYLKVNIFRGVKRVEVAVEFFAVVDDDSAREGINLRVLSSHAGTTGDNQGEVLVFMKVPSFEHSLVVFSLTDDHTVGVVFPCG
jgi:hypothetical protein